MKFFLALLGLVLSEKPKIRKTLNLSEHKDTAQESGLKLIKSQKSALNNVHNVHSLPKNEL